MRKILEVNVDRVEKRRIPSKHYVYVMHVTWSDGGPYRIYRRYSRLFDLQSALLDKFPIEAGSVDPSARIIPFLPGKIIFGRSHIRDVAEKRLEPIDEYCKKLIKLHHKISQCDEVLEFFEVEPEDLDPPTEEKSQDAPKKAEKISKPKTFKQYVAVADYEKQDRGEIDMYRGMVVEVVEKKETGWWFVNSEEAQGWVPSTYLEPADGTKDTNIIIKAPPGHEEKYICCEKFEADGDDEIGLEKGAIVDVLEKNMEGWWLVRYKGRKGYAPATYLIKTEEEERNSLAHRKSTDVEIIQNLADISNIMKNKDGSEEGKEENLSVDYQTTMYSKVQHKSHSLEHGIKPPPRQNSKNGPPIVNAAIPNPSVKKSHYVTIAEFEDTVGDGISFQEGQPVEVKEKNESGWWFVSIEGQDGWVPASYIESQANKENVDDEEGSVYTTIEDSAEAYSDWSAEEDDEFSQCSEESGVEYRKKNKRKKLTDSLMNQFRKRKSGKDVDTKCSDTSDSKHSNSNPALPPLPPHKPSRLEGATTKQNGFSALKESSQGLVNIIKSKLDRPTGKCVDESKKTLTPPVKPVPPQKTPVCEMKPVLPSILLKPEKEISERNGVQVIALPSNKPLVPQSKPSLPAKPVVKPKPAAPPKPSIPAKPSVPAKPSIPAKPSSLKSVLPQKPALPTKQPSLCKPKTAAGPPKLPAKVLPSRKPDDNDDNNNKRHNSQSVNGAAVSGLAAALQSKFENKSGHPPKLPSKPAIQKPAKEDNIRHSNQGEVDSDVPKPNVSNLVNALSNKLSFGGDRPLLFHGGSSDKNVADTIQLSNHIENGRMDVRNDLLSKDTFVALSDFYGETDEELDMSEGDEVQVLEATDGGWWMVQSNRRTGWVPSAYLSRKQEPECPPVPPHANNSAKTLEKRVMRTVYQTSAFFTAECEGELGFEEGVIVDEVKDQSDSDWWLIRIGPDEGWAPSSFLQQVEIEDKRKSFSGSKPVPPKIKPAFGK